VTLFGQSTGSAAVPAILASGRANGLVHRAILQSGASRARPLAEAAELVEGLAKHLGVASVQALCDGFRLLRTRDGLLQAAA
jgi:para-nitrobenzyl esterase